MAEGGSSSQKQNSSGISKDCNVQGTSDPEIERLPCGEITEGPSIPECAVCLQTCVHPAQLPCGHIFCFLCVKGVAYQSKKCAMCRQDIPADYIEKPHLIDATQLGKDGTVFEDGYQWFYEGRNGWWKYDERTSSDLEDIYRLGETSCEMLICGVLYIIDFQANQQYQKSNPRRKRRIKRDLNSLSIKGIAGLQKNNHTLERK